MKYIILGFLLFSQLVLAHVEETDHYMRRGSYQLSPELFGMEELEQALFTKIGRESKDLKKAKYFLLNGKTKEAQLHLSKLAYSNTKLKPIIYRYLAVLSFIQGKYEKSQIYLSLPELNKFPEFAKICTLQVLNQIILNKVQNLEKNWDKCQIGNAQSFRRLNLTWLDTLVKIKVDHSEGITQVPFRKVRLDALSMNDLKILLKLSIYLNQDSLLLPEVNRLKTEDFKDQELREILGHMYFRNGQFVNAYRFIEDLKTPNAETIKGNLYVLQGKYEIAYAQFRLALEMKQNSENALERLLPLSWILGDWQNGSIYTENLYADQKHIPHKLTLLTSFMIQRGEFEKAEKLLHYISQQTGRGTHLDVTQLHSFTKLMRSKVDELTKQADMSCQQYDVVNCWILFQTTHWQDFPFVVRRQGEVEHTEKWKELTSSSINTPLKEAVYVNQLDIEELDDQLVELIPKKGSP
ncbi:MAG: hypothetical protein WDA09_03590 [Bacteriovoracaceae bacterium]